MNDQPKTGSPVAIALLSVLKSDLYVQKAGINREQNYRYAAETDFLEAVRPRLAAAGVVMTPSYEVIETHEGATKAGTPNVRITLAGTFTFTHAETGDTLNVVTIGQGVDTQDKAAYKAMTGALKYALRQTFLIETGDDPEKDAPEEHPSPRPASATPPAPRPAPAPAPAARPTPPAPADSAPGAGPAPAGDALEVTDLKESDGVNKAGNPWKRFTATFNNGVRASTFDTKHGDMLKEAHAKGEPLIVTFEKSGNFTNITSVELFPF